eukprot:TRINITY_DN1695_c0_g1_i12.p2 TRINITY_DN1695_c0_g1~~TRINITY_DN1695_c0_g1_i12.p2  ORF type:complete len:524 (+),score=172.84 TRINITY_DN1695_c0_g1_i12:1155-2726(+)
MMKSNTILLLTVLMTMTASSMVGAVTDFGLMLDAGSSGTRIYIYEYPRPTSDGIPVINSAPMNQVQWSLKITPGIATFITNPSGIEAYLKPLIDYAKQHISDPEEQSRTLLFMGATAGMRLLSPSQIDTVFSSVRTYFNDKSKVPFKFQNDWARVLAGEEEGVYGWMMVNYLQRRLNENNLPKTSMALDLGGASTQITFIPAQTPISNLYDLFISNSTFPTYTHSYLTWGRDQAALRLHQYEIDQNGAQNPSFPSPCYPVGMKQNITVDNKVYTIEGTGNPVTCRSQIKTQLLGTDVYCSAKPCGMMGVYQPAIPATTDIFGFSNYFYTFDFFNCAGKTNISCLKTAMDSQCNVTWNQFEANHPKAPPSFLTEYCFNAGYIVSLLQDGYKIADDRELNIVGKIDNVETGWTLGAMVYQVGLMELAIGNNAGQLQSCQAALANEQSQLSDCQSTSDQKDNQINDIKSELVRYQAATVAVAIVSGIIILVLIILVVVKKRGGGFGSSEDPASQRLISNLGIRTDQ